MYHFITQVYRLRYLSTYYRCH